MKEVPHPGHAGTAQVGADCRVGDRAFIPARHREALVDDVCGNRVRCVWEEDGIRRSAWLEPGQVERSTGHDSR